ncbi:carotenoid oxygenase family protein [Mycolicibacterium iranicum]|uniref:Dioxygenase n=1 Tax=Mycolicibacterium iranicum TaxID=912594 RepID=A0A178LPR9_MYCIR|nr:carotenoid oxygenase family protein [Mycolicibacterium iranicum]OAN33007.1 dioxygenase [Mycolicibacterium iranicum]
MAISDSSVPLYVTGHLAPVADEIDARDLPVEGSLPPELTGRLLRNGPNPIPGEPSGHWFDGHGMVHGIRLEGGRARWYRNRWVRTKALAGHSSFQPDGSPDLTVGAANTHVIAHAGKILALVEDAYPHVLSPELETLGVSDFGGRLTTAMTAHPKIDPVTGDLHFFGYGLTAPYVTYHKASAAGELVTSVPISVPGPTMMHDFAITDRHAVFLDLPLTFSPERVNDSPLPFDWDDSYGARIGIMELNLPGQVRWFDVDPAYVFHVGNAHTDSTGRVILDAARYAGTDAEWAWQNLGNPMASTGVPVRGDLAGSAAVHDSGLARLHRWTLDPATGTVEEMTLDDRGIEFPTIDHARVGRESRYRYAVSGGGPHASAIVKFDTTAGVIAEHSLGPDVVAGEAVFVASQALDRAEDDGWLLTVTSSRDGSGSKLLVLDATDVSGTPVAAVTLPRRVPAGFHGSWITDDELESAEHAGSA